MISDRNEEWRRTAAHKAAITQKKTTSPAPKRKISRLSGYIRKSIEESGRWRICLLTRHSATYPFTGTCPVLLCLESRVSWSCQARKYPNTMTNSVHSMTPYPCQSTDGTPAASTSFEKTIYFKQQRSITAVPMIVLYSVVGN